MDLVDLAVDLVDLVADSVDLAVGLVDLAANQSCHLVLESSHRIHLDLVVLVLGCYNLKEKNHWGHC